MVIVVLFVHFLSNLRGIGIIINNKDFTCGMKERIGTDRDAKALTRLFIYLGFYTNRYDNLKGTEMRGRLQVHNLLSHFSAPRCCVHTYGAQRHVICVCLAALLRCFTVAIPSLINPAKVQSDARYKALTCI